MIDIGLKRRRGRPSVLQTESQLQALKEAFANEKNPSAEDVEILSKNIGLSVAKTKVSNRERTSLKVKIIMEFVRSLNLFVCFIRGGLERSLEKIQV